MGEARSKGWSMDAQEKLRDKLKKLHRLLGSANPNEADAARSKINELLARNKKTWNDLCDLLETGRGEWHDDEDPAPEPSDESAPPPLDLIHHLIERHLHRWLCGSVMKRNTPRSAKATASS
jgi:hypothetical protein